MKKSVRPTAAAMQTSGIAIPTRNPTAPAAFKAPRGNSQDVGTSTLIALATAVGVRKKSMEAAQVLAAAASTARARAVGAGRSADLRPGRATVVWQDLSRIYLKISPYAQSPRCGTFFR